MTECMFPDAIQSLADPSLAVLHESRAYAFLLEKETLPRLDATKAQRLLYRGTVQTTAASSRRIPTRSAVASAFALLSVVAIAAPGRAAAQSTNITDYVLLASEQIKASRLAVVSGDVGVTMGTFFSRKALSAPTSDLGAPVVKLDNGSNCADLFANVAVGAGGSCANPQKFTNPFDDLATACGFPEPFPTCNPGAPAISVGHGQTLNLAPGVYGDVKVEGGAGGNGSLVLNGVYRFCSLTVSKRGKVLFSGPSTVNVAGKMNLSTSTELGPKPGSGTDVDAINFFLNGSSAKFSRKSTVKAIMCGPDTQMNAGSSANLEGRFVFRRIRLKRNTAKLAGQVPGTTSTTTATTSTTTTTTPPAQCGNRHRRGGRGVRR